MEELAHAVAWAKPSFDLVEAARRDATLTRRAERQIQRPSRPRQYHRQPLHGLTPSMRVQTFPQDRGRPRDTWKYALLNDVKHALKRTGVRGIYWHTGLKDTRLMSIYRACAEIAGAPQPGALRGVWERAKSISVTRYPDPPKADHRLQ